MFEATSISVGTLKVGDKITVEFKYDDLTIIDWKAGCGCVAVYNSNNILKVDYIARDIPEHLLREGKNSYKINQQIVVKYIAVGSTEKETIVLDFRGEVVGKHKR